MKINLEYLTPTTIQALYDATKDAWVKSDDLEEAEELVDAMEQLNDYYSELTGETLEDFEKFF